VQGWTENSSGVVDTNQPIGNIVVPTGTLTAPIATTAFSFDANLNAAAVSGQSDATFSEPMNVIDSLGNSHQLTITFTLDTTTPNQWDYSITVPGADVGDTGPQQLASGSLNFDSSGNLINPPASAGGIPVALTGLADQAADMNMTWNLYDASGAPAITQYSQASSTTASSQNGVAPASLTTVGISDGGQILASYSNGTQAVVGQLAIASIRNPQSLIATGNNNFEASEQTALPAIGLPNTGGRGDVVGGSLEASTVDIAKEFTNLIIYQRAYEVNAKVVTTVDQLSQDTVALKQ